MQPVVSSRATPAPTDHPPGLSACQSVAALQSSQPARRASVATPIGALQHSLAQATARRLVAAVERHLRALPPQGTATWLQAQDAAAIDALAIVYVQACEALGRRTLALTLLAARLDAPGLARLARCAGHARVHLALLLSQPGLESAFLRLADPGQRGPRLEGATLPPWPQLLQALAWVRCAAAPCRAARRSQTALARCAEAA